MSSNQVEGRRPEQYVHAVNLEGSFANYAKVGAQWFSVNGGGDGSLIQDVRWDVTIGSPLHRKLDELVGGAL